MNKKLKEVLNGVGMVACAFAMMFAAVGVIYLIHIVFHTNFK